MSDQIPHLPAYDEPTPDRSFAVLEGEARASATGTDPEAFRIQVLIAKPFSVLCRRTQKRIGFPSRRFDWKAAEGGISLGVKPKIDRGESVPG